MKVFKQLREIGEFNDLYLDHLIDKARVSAKRNSKFKHNNYNEPRIPRLMCTGEYKDAELMKGPKYYKKQKLKLLDNLIKSYQDLAEAVNLIISGEKTYQNYLGKVHGINRARIKLAQTWKSQGKSFTISDIVKLNYDEIKGQVDWF